MGVFDKDLIQKDLSVKDILRERIISIANNITYHINEASANGVIEFSRITELGSYGPYDKDIVWRDRYTAFSDYLIVAIGKLQEELNRHPIINDKKSVLIDRMSVFGDIYEGSRWWNKDASVLYKVNVEYTLRSGVIPFVRSERFMTTISFDVSLDPPRPQGPWNSHSVYPYPAIW